MPKPKQLYLRSEFPPWPPRSRLLERLPPPFLVSIPVEMFNAIETKSEISFRQIHKPSGKRVNYEKVVQGIGKVDNSDIVKGYEVDKDEYIVLDPDEIDAVRLESKKTLDLVQFVDAKEIDYRYFERPYFLAPADEMAGEGFVVIRDALRDTGKVGLGQVTVSGREWLVAVAPLEDGLVMEMLRYADELRDPKPYFEDVPNGKPDKEMVALGQGADRPEGSQVQGRQLRRPLPHCATRSDPAER